jgi:hypothetical protein
MVLSFEDMHGHWSVLGTRYCKVSGYSFKNLIQKDATPQLILFKVSCEEMHYCPEVEVTAIQNPEPLDFLQMSQA